MDNFTKKIEILRMVSDFAEKESDRFWRRYTTFFLFNSAFGSIISLSPDTLKDCSIIFYSFLGIISCIVWFYIIPWSFAYQDRWILDQIKIIDSDPMLKDFISGRHRDLRKIIKIFSKAPKKFVKGASSKIPGARALYYMGPISFFIIWLIILIFNLNKLFSICVIK